MLTNSNKKKEWFKELSWNKNPFTLEINLNSFIAKTDKIDEIISAIEDNDKYILITGPTGVGKTTLLKWIEEKYNSFYVPKPPISEDEILNLFKAKLLKPTLIQKILKKDTDLNLYNITEKYNKKHKGKKTLILIDEAHETKLQTLEWIRSLTEQMEGTTLILAGLKRLKTEHLSHLETLMQRISKDIELNPLSKEETINLIKKRISIVNGNGLEPFTLDSAIEIYNQTGGYPREILKKCKEQIEKALNENKKIIDLNLFKEEKEIKKQQQTIEQKLENITPKQKEIINLISTNYPMSPSEIIKNISIKDYKSKSHAIRAINNILKRMVTMNLLTREKDGTRYTYNISPKIKSIQVNA
jgi:type II secretory pathway predicted ATPase ExeA